MTDDLAAIVTAAGASTRMGVHKAILPWRGRPLVAHQVRALDDAGFSPFVVTGAKRRAVEAATPRPATLVHNPDWSSGRSGSIEVAASALDDAVDAVLVVAVDQPVVPRVLQRLVVHAGEPVVQPVEPSGRPGHPVVIGGEHLGRLRELRDEPEGLRSLVRTLRPDGEMVSVPNLPHWDLNDPESYRRARSRAADRDDA